MEKSKIIGFSFIIFAVLIVGAIFLPGLKKNEANALNGFAQCLSQKGLTMYGAYWCSHCQNEKKAFGNSFQYVKYVECTKEAKACTDAGIKGFPTWITADGARFEGEQGVEKLAEISSCVLPAN